MHITRRRTIAAVPVLALLLMGNSSCEPPDCNKIIKQAPSAAQQKAASEVVNGEAVEVEAEITDPKTDSEVECVVHGDRWVNVTDDTA